MSEEEIRNRKMALSIFAMLHDFYNNTLTQEEKDAVDRCTNGLATAADENEALMSIMGLESIFTNDKLERLGF